MSDPARRLGIAICISGEREMDRGGAESAEEDAEKLEFEYGLGADDRSRLQVSCSTHRYFLDSISDKYSS